MESLLFHHGRRVHNGNVPQFPCMGYLLEWEMVKSQTYPILDVYNFFLCSVQPQTAVVITGSITATERGIAAIYVGETSVAVDDI